MNVINGVQLHCLHTTKFKDIGISIRFRNVLSDKTAAVRSLLALMFVDRCQRYNTKQKMSIVQDELYGATLTTQTMGFGQSQLIEVRSKVINPRYIKETNSLLQDMFSFLHEVLFAPLLTEEVFLENKEILLSKIHRMEDDPAQYIIYEGLQRVAEDTPLSISAIGTCEQVEKLTLADVKSAYQSLMEEDLIDIIVCGDVCEEEIVDAIRTWFPFKERFTTVPSFYTVQSKEALKRIQLTKHISQSYIMMIWFTNQNVMDKDYDALKVANGLFGQYSTSLLFQEVREKRSLCYSIYSNLIAYDGAMAVTTGVEKENIEEAITLIQTQFQRMCALDFNDERLQTTKKMIINSLQANNDHMNAMMALSYRNILLNQKDEIKDMIERIKHVTKEDIKRVMEACEYKLCLVLTKENEDE